MTLTLHADSLAGSSRSCKRKSGFQGGSVLYICQNNATGPSASGSAAIQVVKHEWGADAGPLRPPFDIIAACGERIAVLLSHRVACLLLPDTGWCLQVHFRWLSCLLQYCIAHVHLTTL